MNTTPSVRHIALACLAAVAACPASAQDSAYPYIGLALGQARAKFDQTGIDARLRGPGIKASTLTSDEHDRAYRLFGGYQLNRYFALEAAFFDLGQFSYASTVAAAPASGIRGNFKVQGGGLDAVATLPLGDTFSLLGRVGGQYARTRDSFTSNGGVLLTNPTPSERGANYKVGVGLQVAFSPAVQMRIEADRYRIRDGVGGQSNVNMYSASLVFPFGREVRTTARAPSPVVAMAAPRAAPPAPAPAPSAVVVTPPAPPPVVMAPAPAPRRVSFNAESLFGYDRSQLRPEGMTALDAFARDAAGSNFEVVVVRGHADRTGSAAYNQKLSLARAGVVKNYLVTKGGFDASRITASGMGETQPLTKPGDCPASMSGAKLHTCLQPDRRVDVELSGTR